MTEKQKRPATAWKPGQSGNPKGRAPGVERAQAVEMHTALELPAPVAHRGPYTYDNRSDSELIASLHPEYDPMHFRKSR